MNAVRTYTDGDIRGITRTDDGCLLIWVGEGHSHIIVLTPGPYGNVTNIESVEDSEKHPVVEFLNSCAETGNWGENLKMSHDMILMYDAIRNPQWLSRAMESGRNRLWGFATGTGTDQ